MGEQMSGPTPEPTEVVPAEHVESLPPGAGAPLRPGAPASVRAPMADTTINRTAGLGAAVAIVAVLVLVVLAALFLIRVLTHH